ncbi:hypothetical protein [Moorena sp. SIO4G3]|nr:hypothetical protein [Moorena sp. SIO4G3]
MGETPKTALHRSSKVSSPGCPDPPEQYKKIMFFSYFQLVGGG